MVTGVVPHVGGPILPPCQVNVLTGMLPQARITDLAMCAGPPDMIIQGAFTVLVGGLPAARLGDMTAHGGVIVMGCFTVLIGDVSSPSAPSGPVTVDPMVLKDQQIRAKIGQLKEGGYSDKKGKKPKGEATYGKAIKIKGDEAFQKKVIADLDAIKKTPTGAKLLEALEKSGKTITIKPTKDGNATGFTNDGMMKNGKPGPGSNSTVEYDPDTKKINSEDWGTRPPAIGLAHELIHARHAAEGTVSEGEVDNDSKPDPADPKKIAKEDNEEVRTVGLPPYDKEETTENKIRSEWDPPQPKRKWY